MNNLFAVVINNVPELEYDRDKSLSDQQQQFLEKMDRELAGQIVIGGQVIEQPDLHQRAQFVAINLLNALKNGNDALAAAMCSFLALRVPGLKKLDIKDQDGQAVIDLVFDEDYVKQVNVEFTPKPPTRH